VYVSGVGSDTTGDGSAGNPYRSLTFAVANRGTDTEIRAAAGSYDAANGEVFPITFGGGVSIIGTRGVDDTAANSSVVDAGGLAQMFTLTAQATLRNLVMTRALGNTITATSCTLTVDNCLITDVTNASAIASAIYAISAPVTITNTTFIDINTPSTKHVIGVGKTGSRLTMTNCLLKNLICGASGYGEGVLSCGWEWGGGGDGTGGGYPLSVTITDTVFDNIKSSPTGRPDGGMVIVWGTTFLVDRCTFRNINANAYLVNERGCSSTTVRNSLFYNIANGDFGAASSDQGTLNARNCTFDNCSSVSRIERSNANFYNCSISNCTKFNSGVRSNYVLLYNTNVYNTLPGLGYNVASSINVTDYNPKYVSTTLGAENYRLQSNSWLVDAGNNANVDGTIDLDQAPRIQDGNVDGTETVDLGAYEFDPADALPAFSMLYTNRVYAGATVDVAVSVSPAVDGAVEASISYGDGISGPASIEILAGGTATLPVTAASGYGSTSGTAIGFEITCTSGPEVLAKEAVALVYTRELHITDATRIYIPQDAERDLPVKLVSTLVGAPEVVTVTTGTPQGVGTSSIVWAAANTIDAGATETAGALHIVGGAGLNTVMLTVDKNFVFQESGGAASFTLEVMAFPNPIYVSDAGDDNTGLGTELSPFRTITAALKMAAASSDIDIIVCPGSYDAAAGEVFPLVVPASTRIVGTMGTNQDTGDSSVIDAGGLAKTMTLAATGTSRTGLLQNLVFTGARGATIEGNSWKGTIDNCLFTNVTNASASASAIYGPKCDMTITNTTFTNINTPSTNHIIGVGGTGSRLVMSNCLLKDLICGGSGYGEGVLSCGWEYGGGYPSSVTITDTVFDNIRSATPGRPDGGMVVVWGTTFLVDRCTFRNINANAYLVNERGCSSTTVRNSLFYNVSTGSSGSVIFGAVNSDQGTLNVRNCTFDDCSTVTRIERSNANFYNSSISNCTRFNSGVRSNYVVLYNTNVYETPPGLGYNTTSSVNVTAYEPRYKNAGNADYRLASNSQLIDAGNDAYASGYTLDLAGNDRIMGDRVDIGALEFDPAFIDPAFKPDEATYRQYSGTQVVVPIRIVPAATGAVTADVAYGDDLSVLPTELSFPNGAGPVDLTVTVAAAPTVENGGASDVSITESSSRGVLPGQFTVYIHRRLLEMTGATTIYVPQEQAVEFAVKLLDDDLLTAPGAITISAGTPAGDGSNSIEWTGDNVIPDGDTVTEGVLSVTGGLGRNSITLTAGNGFMFNESQQAAFTLTVVGFASPIYVAATGSDETGLGTEAAPFRTVAYALTMAAESVDVDIIVGPGTYDTAAGEVFPLVVPSGATIVGTMGEDRDAGDSTVIDAGGTAKLMTVAATGANRNGLLQNLVLTGALGATIEGLSWKGTIDNCLITNVTNASAIASAIYAPASDMTITNTIVQGINTPSAKHVIGVGKTGCKLVMSDCLLKDLASGGSDYGEGVLSCGWEWGGGGDGTGGGYPSSVTITDTTFDNLASPNTWRPDGGIVIAWECPFTIDRCTFKNITCNYYLVNYRGWGGHPVNVRNSLFYAVNTGDYGAVNRDQGPLTVRNCTFDACSTVVKTDRSTGDFYNCSVSNTDKFGTGSIGSTAVKLYSVNLWNTPALGFDAENSVAVTNYQPGYVNAAARDYHLSRSSLLVDAGNDDYVNWSDEAVDLDQLPRIADGNGDDTAVVDLGCFELQPPGGAIVTEFTAADQSTGSNLFTNSATVNVAFTVNVPENVTVTGWLVTQSATAPTDGWLLEEPTKHVITGPEGQVTLYGWIVDSTDAVSGKSATIYYNTAAPVVSNVLVTDNGNDTATATWTTDIPAAGALTFSRVTGDTTPATVPEGALRTAHSVQFPIETGVNYKIILTNNEVVSAPFYWPQLWPIEGDANGDCRVNILDLIFIRNRLNGDVGTGDNIKADVNLDTRINILDLIYVRNRLNNACP